MARRGAFFRPAVACCDTHTAGALQHIGSESRLGDWPRGRALLDRLIARVSA